MDSGEPLMMGRGTARNIQSFLKKINLEKLVPLLVLLKRNLYALYKNRPVNAGQINDCS
jgi:hypothetical protein